MNLYSLTVKLQKLRHQLVSGIHVAHFYDTEQRNAMRELTAMTDRELQDIGISRADIGQIVQGIRA